MRLSSRIFLSILFIPILGIFLVLTSVKFQLLNYNFVTQSFKKHDSYSKVPILLNSSIAEGEDDLDKEEKQGLEEVVKIITPEFAESIVERNLKEIANFVDGKSDDIVLYFPLQKPETFSLSNLGGDRVKSQMKQARNTSSYLLLVWAIILFLLISLLFMHYKLGGNKKLKGTGILLIICGSIFTILATLAMFFLRHTAEDLIKPGKEPAQNLLGILASSVLPEITQTWLTVAVALLTTGVVLSLFSNFSPHKNS